MNLSAKRCVLASEDSTVFIAEWQRTKQNNMMQWHEKAQSIANLLTSARSKKKTCCLRAAGRSGKNIRSNLNVSSISQKSDYIFDCGPQMTTVSTLILAAGALFDTLCMCEVGKAKRSAPLTPSHLGERWRKHSADAS